VLARLSCFCGKSRRDASLVRDAFDDEFSLQFAAACACLPAGQRLLLPLLLLSRLLL
jgi:hypothetical protein